MLGGVGGFVAGRYDVDNKMPILSDEYVLFVRPDMRAYLLPLALLVGYVDEPDVNELSVMSD